MITQIRSMNKKKNTTEGNTLTIIAISMYRGLPLKICVLNSRMNTPAISKKLNIKNMKNNIPDRRKGALYTHKRMDSRLSIMFTNLVIITSMQYAALKLQYPFGLPKNFPSPAVQKPFVFNVPR